MACFYCGKRSVNSPDVGDCAENCAKPVCIEATSSRPQDYHADQCNCGCAKLVCIYEQDMHARNAHQSSVEDCFPDSAAISGLGAAWAIEHSAQVDIDLPNADQAEIRRALFRYLTVKQSFNKDRRWLFGTTDSPNYFELQLPEHSDWPWYAAGLVPRIMETISRSWPRMRNLDYKYGLGRELNERLDRFAKLEGSEFSRPLRLRNLQNWYRLSPRLTMLVVQQSAVRGIDSTNFTKLFGIRGSWASAPATLEAVIQQRGAPPLTR